MSDLQSNRAFTLSDTPYLYSGRHYRYGLLPPSMPGEKLLTFWCFFDDDPQVVPFEITVPVSDNVARLKKCIREEKCLHGVDITSIVLWKLTDPVPLAPEADLAKRIKKKRLERSDRFARKLIAQGEHMSTIFSQSLLKDHVYIMAQLPTAKQEQIDEVFCWVLNLSSAPFPVDIGKSMTVGRLKDAIKKKKENALSAIDPDTLELWKLSPPGIPSAEIDTKLRDVQSPQQIPGCIKLNATNKLSEYFSSPPRNHLHIIVETPPKNAMGLSMLAFLVAQLSRSRSTPGCTKFTQRSGRQHLRSEIFREVEVTAAQYAALQKRLKEKHPDRDSPDYNASRNDVLSIKLEILNQTIPASAPSSFVQRAHSGNEQILVQNDKDLEEIDGNNDTEFNSFLPATLKFLDLSSLELQKQPTRLPLPLFLREEYNLISGLLEEESEHSNGSAIVSGQPGTGKTAFLHLRMIEYMISGRAFLYQTLSGVVYHVSENIEEIEAWSPDTNEPIVAFVDADSGSGAPNPYFRYRFVKIIAASSPGGTDQSWLKQGDNGTFVANFGADLWSPSELFLTGIFLHPLDLTFRRLRESVSYFGYNPRRCFIASQSNFKLRQLMGEIQNKIRCIAPDISILTLLDRTFTTRGISHSIFELAPSDNMRMLLYCQIGAVFPWALDVLLKEYENRAVDAVADFYIAIADKPFAGSLRGRLLERQVLKYFDTFLSPHDFSMRSLASPAVSTWTYPGPTKRVTFDLRSFTPSLTSAVKDKLAQHLVPSDPNFPAVDSILYNPAEGLVCIQVTIKDTHPVAISGLERIQAWLKRGTPLEDFRPSTSGKHWPLIFVVPEIMAPDYKLQDFEGDTNKCEWARKVDQYVVGINEDIVWGRAMKTS